MVDLEECSRECSRRAGGKSQALRGRSVVVAAADQAAVDRLDLVQADCLGFVVVLHSRERGNG